MEKELPRGDKGKAVATDGGKYVSGWKDAPEGFSKVSPNDVATHAKEIGHDLQAAGGADQVNGGGFPGKYHASHAEKQHSVARPNEPVAVNIKQCPDCQKYFSKEAIFRGQDQIVTDPEMTRIFHPDGSVTRIPH